MTRILLVPSAFHHSQGGVEEITRNLAAELTKQRFDVKIVVHRYPQDLPEMEKLFDLEVHRFDFHYPKRSLDQIFCAPTIAQSLHKFKVLLKSWKPDIVHIICPSTAALYVYFLRKFVNTKILVTFQGELFMDEHMIYDKSALMRFGLKKLLSIADGVTACSEYVMVDARRKFKIDQPIQEVVFNGVDLNEPCANDKLGSEKDYIFSVGRLVHNKGLGILVKAFELIAESHPGIELIIAGDGGEKKQLQQAIDSAGMTERIKLIGSVQRAHVGAYFRDCAFFVLPSPVEPFGIVCLEAMRSGKAIIATNTGGPPEFIEDGKDGLLVTPNDPKSIGEAIEKLLNNPELRSKMGDLCRQKVERFAWTKIAKEYILVYDKLLI